MYKCLACGRQFREDDKPDNEDLWTLYQARKQTIDELASHYGVSGSTIKRRLRNIHKGWLQLELTDSGFVHIDATYWGRNWGILLAIDELTGNPLYLSFIKHETNSDYRTAVESIEARGYRIKGTVIDGRQSLFDVFRAQYSDVPIPYVSDCSQVPHKKSKDACGQRAEVFDGYTDKEHVGLFHSRV